MHVLSCFVWALAVVVRAAPNNDLACSALFLRARADPDVGDDEPLEETPMFAVI